MNDRIFNHAMTLVLLLEEKGCLKQGPDLDDPINSQKPIKKCGTQLKALIVLQTFLSSLNSEQPELEEALKPETHQCPHCGAHSIS
jgi:hypothetical protein